MSWTRRGELLLIRRWGREKQSLVTLFVELCQWNT